MPGRSLDIYLPLHTTARPLPALLFLPGGGLVDCNRKQCTTPDKLWLPSALFSMTALYTIYERTEQTLAKGIVLLSAEYPTLRTTDGHGILHGIRALVNFISTKLTHIVDASRVGVYASSAGCYVALQAVLHTEMRFKALALMWPMGPHFLVNDWWIQPWPEIKGFFERIAADHPLREMLLKGKYLDALTGEDGYNARLRAVSAPEERRKVVTGSARSLFPELNIAEAKHWPPTGITHGLRDTATSPDESRHLKAMLDARGDVRSELRLVEGGEHGLEDGVDAQAVREEVWHFVVSRL